MFLKEFKTEIDETHALRNAKELARMVSALVPSIALVEIVVMVDYDGANAAVICHPRTELTEGQRLLLNKVLFGVPDSLYGSCEFGYDITLERDGNKISAERQCVLCDRYPWFAPPELEKNAQVDAGTDPLLSIRVPRLTVHERLTIEGQWWSQSLLRSPHMRVEISGLGFESPCT